MTLRVVLDDDQLDALAERIARRLTATSPTTSTTSDPDRWLTSRDAAAYLGLSLAALHRLTSARTIPFSQDAPGGRCWFKRRDLDGWREQGRRGPQ